MSLGTEVKFITNAIRESLVSPRSTSVIDKATGKVVNRRPVTKNLPKRKGHS